MRALLCVLLTTGCVAGVSFDVVGDGASVQGSWRIGGATPSEASCSALGIDFVRVRFYRPDGRHRDHAGLVFPCAQGSFDTRPEAVVATGAWDMALVAIDSNGVELALGPTATYDTAELGGHIAIPEVDFTGFDPRGMDVLIDASWTIGSAVTTESSCTGAGGTEVAIVVFSAADTARAAGTTVATAPCAAGQYMSAMPELGAGRYLFSLVLLDAGGNAIGQADLPLQTLVRGRTVRLEEDIRLLATTVAFPIDWPSSSGCTGVSAMYWELFLGSSADPLYTARSDRTEPCREMIALSARDGHPITRGGYRLVVEGDDAGGATRWRVAAAPCVVTVENNGDLALAPSACVLEMLP